ncbi:hypothetical protein B7494_g7350 [Chlorociboria aeruginascens]|nr:hypothetical protein B7494_g7350 [Chlorociboria aeruginascens]
MATTTTATPDPALNKEFNEGSSIHDHGTPAVNGAHANNNNNNNTTANRPRYDYGGNPLYHANTGDSARFPAFGGEFQPGLYRPTTERKFANPAPLGLSAFALTTFILSLINVGTRNLLEPNIVVALAFGYGGLVQLLAGMWEMAVGNTFGATALSSYGGFWISFAIVLTPGGFDIVASYTPTSAGGSSATAGVNDFNNAFGLFLMGWFIFTFILLLCTLRSTVAFFLLFFFLDLAFLLLGLARLYADDAGNTNVPINKAGGYFGLFAAIMAWYSSYAGLADDSNSFWVVPVVHFPWSVKGRELRSGKHKKSERETV